MQHPKLVAWERKLRQIFEKIDDDLEEKYGDNYPLHPARSEHGSTSTGQQDGLFSVGAAFSAGYGSEHGRGYIVEIRMVTLSSVPAEVREKIEQEVVEKLNAEIDEEFPDRQLDIIRDGNVYKIVGDLSLGSL